MKLADGEQIPVHSAIGLREIELIQRIIHDIRPARTLEVGMAYGISTLAICEALIEIGGGPHIVIDPDQHEGKWGDGWRSGGLTNLEKAGFSKVLDFHEAPSHQVLPKLEAARKIPASQFTLIDGWPAFDYRLMDFVMVDRVLDVGGILLMAATNMPGVRKACRFIATNRSYRVYDNVSTPHDHEVLARVNKEARGLEVTRSIRRHLSRNFVSLTKNSDLGEKVRQSLS